MFRFRSAFPVAFPVLTLPTRALLVVGVLVLMPGCDHPPTPGFPPGLIPPDVRFASAPEVGEPFPDIEIVDDQGEPVRIRELAKKKPYTVLTLGCLT